MAAFTTLLDLFRNVTAGDLNTDKLNVVDADGNNKLDQIIDLLDGTGTVKSFFAEISSVASGSLTTIQTYTVPVSKTAKLGLITASGTNIASYEVTVNSVIQERFRTFWGVLNGFSDFGGLPLVAGDTITVKVIHNRPTLGDFSCRIQLVEI